jgi:hypothetical protein
MGAELPTRLSNLDPEGWRPIHLSIELIDPEDGPSGNPKACLYVKQFMCYDQYFSVELPGMNPLQKAQ